MSSGYIYLGLNTDKNYGWQLQVLIYFKDTILLFHIFPFLHQLLSVLNPSVSHFLPNISPNTHRHPSCLSHHSFYSQSSLHLGKSHICVFTVRCWWVITACSGISASSVSILGEQCHLGSGLRWHKVDTWGTTFKDPRNGCLLNICILSASYVSPKLQPWYHYRKGSRLI